MSLIHLPINIISYTFITLILSLFLSFDNIRYKKYQLYEFKKDQLICIGILTVFCIYLAVSYFGIPLEIKFETTDPNVHYFAANQFANSDVLVNYIHKDFDIYEGSVRNMMPLFYTNAGFFMKGLSDFFYGINNYQSFLIYIIYSFTLSVLVVFVIALQFLRQNKLILFGLIFCIFYAMGYPYNQIIFGFGYLGDTVLVILLLLLSLQMFCKHTEDFSKIEKIIMIIILGILNFSIFFGYYMFMPAVYGAVFLFYLYFFYKKKRLFSKEFWSLLFVTLIIPFCLGAIQFFIPMVITNVEALEVNTVNFKFSAFSLLEMEGYIYRDLYSNFIVFIPFCLYFIYHKIKISNLSFDFWLILCMLAFTLLEFLLGMKGYASSYYYFKNYYVLAPLLFYTLIYSIDKLYIKEFKI